jgi:MutS domain V
MTPRDRYHAQIGRWSARLDAASAHATAISRLRLVSFFAAAIALFGGVREGLPWMIAAAAGAFVWFGYLVVRHARVLADVDRAQAAIAINREGIARLARDWATLPDVAPPPDLSFDMHPYVRDLDLYGHASLTKWLGRTATLEGARRLAGWLLAPSPVEDSRARQHAVDELAAIPDWRESLAIEGRLNAAAVEDLSRFFEWAESDTRAVPSFLAPLAYLLPVTTWVLIAVWLVDASARLPPMTPDTIPVWIGDALVNGRWVLVAIVNLTLSFAVAKRVGGVFDRATLGQPVLDRYGASLALVCGQSWRAPLLVHLQSTLRAGGSAPDMVRRLARLVGWSELRHGAALLHLPIQALTLSDFHVVLAMERWRSRGGREVRRWFETLGSVDALAVLSIVRADEPDWRYPEIDSAARELTATALGHPLLPGDRRVSNDVQIGPPGSLLFITGSNMSGKSTLLRAIGLNAVIAQAGAPVCAAALRMPPVRVFTSIRIEDSLEHGVSYFMAALARLKQIVDAAERTGPDDPILFYLLDEVLQGTNSIERALAVRAVARHLLDAGAIGAMTSHDLTLADEEPIKSAATLAHFTEQVHAGGTMSFDYTLRPGLATSRNAIRLMQLIGITPQ